MDIRDNRPRDTIERPRGHCYAATNFQAGAGTGSRAVLAVERTDWAGVDVVD